LPFVAVRPLPSVAVRCHASSKRLVVVEAFIPKV
jgi:hypothetical protein